ncbi:MAG: hypothetical protein V2A74_14500 [bacterium]
MTDPRALLTRPAARGWIACGAAVVLAIYYFTVGNTFTDIARQVRGFYGGLRPGWALLRESEVRGTLLSGNADGWHTLVVRAALDRWRLRTLAHEPFDNIMSDYARGWWIEPNREVWERLFRENDARWLDERRRALEESTSPFVVEKPPAEGLATGLLRIRFPAATDAARIGSRVRIVIEGGKTPPPRLLAVYWETDKAPGLSQYRRRLALVSPPSDAASGPKRYTAELDFSWEPAWLAPGVHSGALYLAAPGAESWKVLSLTGDDSPLLPR